jgi:UDP-N-acetylmuramoyl-tripeptide--D-alanyl-D-alanine ligase
MTPLFSSADISAAIGAVSPGDFDVFGVSIDTRTLRPGDLFIALRTENGDGNRFLAAARDAGAAAAIADYVPPGAKNFPVFLVEDTQKALTALGAFARARFAGRVIAVTGSVGKTTTKEMLRAALSACGKTHAAQASYNNHWGVPLTLALMPPDADYAVIEIGMNNAGEIAPLARLAAPHVALITIIAPAHIGNMGSMDAIADEKASIMGGLIADGIAILPGDQAQLARIEAYRPKTVSVRYFRGQDVIAAVEDQHGSTVTALVAGEKCCFRLHAPGRHMINNALAALNGAVALGASLKDAITGIENFTPVAGRGVQKPILGGAATLLDESYNANTASVCAALAVLKLLPASRRIAVLGDMLELGDFAESEHVSLAQVLRDSADLLYACGPAMKFLFESCPKALQGAYAIDSAALAPVVAAAVRAGDAVLVKGSFGSRMRLVVSALEAKQA